MFSTSGSDRYCIKSSEDLRIYSDSDLIDFLYSIYYYYETEERHVAEQISSCVVEKIYIPTNYMMTSAIGVRLPP